MQRSVKFALAAVVVVVLVGGAGFWYFVLRDDAPERASLDALATDAAPQGEPEVDSDVAALSTPEGQWVIETGEGVFAGYRIQELFAGETIKKTAAGRTPSLAGTLTIEGDRIVAVEVTADLEELESDSSRRDATQRDSGLEIDRFPTTTFVLTEPIDLPGVPEQGSSIDVVAVGELTLHGVTRPVELTLQARWDGTTIDVAGGTGIVLADYGIEPPRTTFVSVDDQGEFEIQLRFGRRATQDQGAP
jgi:polyisoprenoid-binding protein YceI